MRSRWVYVQGEAIPIEEYIPPPSADFHVLPDLEPFRSPDGAHIGSRAQWREHLKRTDSIEMGHSDVKSAQAAWSKRRDAFQQRTQGVGVKPAQAPAGDIKPIQRSGLNVEIANRLHGKPAPARKELIKLSLDLAKRMSKNGR